MMPRNPMSDSRLESPESLPCVSDPQLEPGLLRVLIVEPSLEDTQSVLRELAHTGRTVVHERVDNLPDLRAALAARRWDVVISDAFLPGFGALEAYAELKRSGVEAPFLIIADGIAEQDACEAMRAGVDDCISKRQLARLAPAVERELREMCNRRALNRAHRDFRRAIDLFPDGVVIHYVGRIRYVNQALCDALGLASPDQVVDHSLLDFAIPADRERVDSAIFRPKRGTVEVRLLRADGTEITCELSAGPVVEFEGQKASVLAVRDVTERNRMRAGLIVADRMASMGTLAAGVAHEINNPLASVISNIDWVCDELGPAWDSASTPPELDRVLDAVRQPLRDAQESAQRVREIVRELKLFSRIEQERLDRIDVHRMVETAIKMARNEIRHRARLITDFDATPPVLGNEGRIGQVILNLVINAVQAIPEGRAEQNEIRVVVRTNATGWAVIEVSDTGTGIPPELLHRIFDPFFTTKPAGVGTGLGLAICDRIVSEAGGSLTVESEVGKGSTFRVTLPGASGVPDRAPIRTQPPQSVPLPTRRGRVLVVDDEHTMGIALGRILGREHDVAVLTNARDAAQRYSCGERFDVVVCDMMMPGMTGMELQQAIERVAPGHGARMIFLTGGAFTPLAREFLERTASPTLSKPFDARTLRALVNRMIARHSTP